MDLICHESQNRNIINNKIQEYTHKRHQEEIFLESLFVINESKGIVRFTFGSKHRHYNDSINVPYLLNPMLLLECCRQAETYIAHQLLAVDMATKFVLKSWRLDVVKENYEKFYHKNYHAFDIHVKISGACDVKASSRKNKYDFLIQIEDVIIARAEFDVSYVNDFVYSILRGAIASDGDAYNMPRLAAHFVGYKLAYNSILSNFEKNGGQYRALININMVNITYNDHDHDHITGMNIVEAAKQFCFCYLFNVFGVDGAQYQMIWLKANYYLYVDLYKHAHVCMGEFVECNADDYRFVVHILQNEKIKAKCELQLSKF